MRMTLAAGAVVAALALVPLAFSKPVALPPVPEAITVMAPSRALAAPPETGASR